MEFSEVDRLQRDVDSVLPELNGALGSVMDLLEDYEDLPPGTTLTQDTADEILGLTGRLHRTKWRLQDYKAALGDWKTQPNPPEPPADTEEVYKVACLRDACANEVQKSPLEHLEELTEAREAARGSEEEQNRQLRLDNRYRTLQLGIRNLLNPGGAPEAEGSGEELDESLTLVDTQISLKDPISQQDITDPVRNRHCHHPYDRATILAHIAQRRRARTRCKCPHMGCTNNNPLTEADLEDYPQLLRKAKQQHE